MLTLTDGTLFPPGCRAIPWGRASGPAGLAPKALEECVLLQGFFRSVVIVRGVCFSRPRRCHSHVFDVRVRSVHIRGVALCQAPEPGPVRGDRGGLSDLFVRPLAVPPRDGG
jgi:hypothetical protein